MELLCTACGNVEEPEESHLEDGSILACDQCGWVVVFEKGSFRAPTLLEATFMLNHFPLMLQLGQITLQKQLRVMGYASQE